ncbi:xanthine uracil permease family protein [Agrilactobacillus composti DSM 18527 = JCM 14202]|uniref:Xanthine uracil permease family protein n=1 Tax=Agrilactobacillus composti DSM 18527 = JCM 14202 TaxID=1423734 RepID=X0PLH7_9LACO|nr:solute carrier family 23 protein [Agrilactobacillus composti]KRM30642.1 xanthine uracil permease family protein [Agrilactobacillus composti DSM 18527 = JCM 14202]GAF38267.1 xanthine-uracil permease [Agrilactobacillus composti DSM 18527 = JCM 14202]
MMKQAQKLPADEKLPLSQSLPLGFQHMVIAVLSAIPVPLIVSAAVKLSAAQTMFFVSSIIFATGISTLLASLNIIPKTSPKLPMVMGVNFSVASVMIITFKQAGAIDAGFEIIAGSTMIAGLFCLLIGPFWNKMQRFFPPLVVGTNLMVLGVALLPNAFNWLMDKNAGQLTKSVNVSALLLGLGVFIFHVFISKYLKGFMGDISILVAIVVGTIVAALLGMTDFSAVNSAPWFGLVLPFHFGLPKFDATATLSFLIIMVLGMVELSGTSMGIHDISQKPATKDQFSKTFRTLGISTIFSGAFNAAQPTAFVANIGVLDLAKKKSRYTTAAAGFMLILVGLVPKFSALISAIPKPVLGGVGFAIFGAIVGSAVNILKPVDFKGNHNGLVIGLSIGVCMLPSVYPNFYGNFPTIVQTIFGSGILAGSLMAICLNLFFNFKELMKPASKEVVEIKDSEAEVETDRTAKGNNESLANQN